MSNLEAARKLLEACDYAPIGDYALIGDGRSAALVARDGSVDWLCLPEFASPAHFAALLDRRRGGRFIVRPRAIGRIERRYAEGSAILETTFHCTGGVLRLTDFMPLVSDPALPHEVLRLAECLHGEVEIDAICEPRPDYGQPVRLQADNGGWLYRDGHGTAWLRADMPLEAEAHDVFVAGFKRLRAGEQCRFGLAYTEGSEAPEVDLAALPTRLALTRGRWQAWSRRCKYSGPHAETVRRSVLTLKLLSHEPSGAPIAAPTAALPESFDAERNWDYRYAWLRDASLLLQSFMDLGYEAEGSAFIHWLLGLPGEPLRPCYGIDGSPPPQERALPWLEGYRGCAPVRVGNAGASQAQIGVQGEAIHAAARFIARRGRLSEPEKARLAALGEVIVKHWRQPDQGLWEVRTPPRRHTHSYLMSWVALDHLIALKKPLGLAIDEIALRRERERLRHAIERECYHPDIGAYVGYVGGSEPDASLLLMARYGYGEPNEPRLSATWRFIAQHLERDGFFYRYPPGGGYDGLPGRENLFVACNFWAVDYLARAGNVQEANRLFERLLKAGSELGLYGEEMDADDRRPLGNFPHAASHAGLIAAALAIEQAERGWKGRQIAA